MLFKRMMMVICLLSLSLAACQSKTPVPTPDILSGGQALPVDTWSENFKAEIEWVDCTFEVYQSEPECGFLKVPQDYSQPNNGETLRLGFARYKTKSTEPKTDPLVLVSGYPLMSQIPLAFVFEDLFKERDLLIFDSRGAGVSEPNLVCPDMNAAILDALPMGGLSPEEYGKLYEQCRQTWEVQQINLDVYSMGNRVNDIKALRLALGYPEWNILTLEPTGAYMAYEALRLDSDGVRSLVFDSAVPVYLNELTEYQAAQKTLTELFTLCATDEKCNDAFPDLENTFYKVVDRLNNTSIQVEATLMASGQHVKVQVDGNYLVEIVLSAASGGDKETIGLIPRMIYQLNDGVTEQLVDMVGRHLYYFDASYDGMYSFLLCRQMPLPDENKVAAALSSLPTGLSEYFDESDKVNRAACEAWEPLPTVMPSASGTSFAPVLVTNGSWNWEWGSDGSLEQFKKSVPEAQVVTFPMVGGFNNAFTCTQDLITAFIENPGMQVDTACVPTERDITWITFR